MNTSFASPGFKPLGSIMLAAALSFSCAPGALHAAPITYTFTGVGSGSLGGTPFVDASFTLTATADTTQITHQLPPLFDVLALTTTLSVGSLGTATFTTNLHLLDFENPNATEASAGLFLFYQGPKLFSVQNAEFQTYDLSRSIGPLSGTPSFGSALFPTTAGDFSLTAVSSGTFQALVQPVPEPCMLALFGLAAAMLATGRKGARSTHRLLYSSPRC